jgi:probable O-glycosylation ligase (exosortase A-associated)
MMVAIPTLVGPAFSKQEWRFFFGREIWVLALLWIWFTITTLRDTSMPEFMHFASDTWFRWGYVSKVMLMAVVTVAVVNSWERFRWLLIAMSGCFGFLVVKAVPFMIITGGSFRLYGPRGSTVFDNNDLGLALNMTVPMFFFLARTATKKRAKQLLWFLFAATIPCVLFTYSRGALIGLGCVLILMTLWSRHRMMLIPVLMLAAIFAVFLTPERWQQRMDFRRDGALIDASAMSRFNSWTYSFNLATAYPLTGGGFECFTQPLYDRYAPNPQDVHGPHSVYFGVLAEHGFPGLLLYLSLLFSCFLTLRQVGRYARRLGDTRMGEYAAMLKFSLVGFMVTGAFLGRAYFDYYFGIVVCVAILRRLCQFELAGINTDPQAETEYADIASEPLVHARQ